MNATTHKPPAVRRRTRHARKRGVLALCGLHTALALATNEPVVVAPRPVVLGPPPVSTNLPPTEPAPVVSPVGPVPVVSGTAVHEMFGASRGGKFGVVGRALTLPVETNAPPVASPWRRQIELGLSLTSGNSDTLRYTASVDARRETEQTLVRLRGSVAEGESEGMKDTENMGLGERFELLLTEKWYVMQTLDWWRDPIAEIDYRVTGIWSPGYHLVRTVSSLVNLEAGAGYVQEQKDGVEDGYMAGRLAVALERVLNPYVMGWLMAEYLPRVDDMDVYFMNAEAGLSSALPPRLALNVVLRERYDSSPIDEKESSDLALTASLSARF